MYSMLSDEKSAGGNKGFKIYVLRNVGYIDRPSGISSELMSSNLGGGKRGGGDGEQLSKYSNYKDEMHTVFDAGVSVEAPVFTKAGKRSNFSILPQVNALNEFNVEEVSIDSKTSLFFSLLVHLRFFR
jgi:hypothetical protein